jgi:hypothetical protein
MDSSHSLDGLTEQKMGNQYFLPAVTCMSEFVNGHSKEEIFENLN